MKDHSEAQAPQETGALIDHILTNYHQMHRADLASLVPLAERVEQVVKSLKGEALEDEMVIEQAVARVLKKASQQIWDRRPIVETIVLRL